MRVYIVRHAIAVPRGTPGVTDDASRVLTPDGIKKMKRQAKGLAGMGIELSRIWTSPYARASQTADIVAAAFKMADPPQVLDALIPGGSFDDIVATLTSHADLNEVALVGHEPDLSETICRLLTGIPGPFVQMKKGGVACIEIENMSPPCRGTLVWLLAPKQLRDLG